MLNHHRCSMFGSMSELIKLIASPGIYLSFGRECEGVTSPTRYLRNPLYERKLSRRGALRDIRNA